MNLERLNNNLAAVETQHHPSTLLIRMTTSVWRKENIYAVVLVGPWTLVKASNFNHPPVFGTWGEHISLFCRNWLEERETRSKVSPAPLVMRSAHLLMFNFCLGHEVGTQELKGWLMIGALFYLQIRECLKIEDPKTLFVK